MATTLDKNQALADRMSGSRSSAIRDLLTDARRPGMISFAGGLPNAGGFDTAMVREAFNKALADGEHALQYGVTEGEPILQDQLVRLMESRGLTTTPDNIIVTTGSQQCIDLLARLLINPGDSVLVERPCYLAALSVFRMAQANIIGVDADQHGLRVDQLDQVYERLRAQGKPSPKVLYVVPDFANPSGVSLSLARRQALIAWAIRNNVLVIEDNPYGELGFAPDYHHLPTLMSLATTQFNEHNCVVHMSTLSKIVSPALRIGWMVLPSSLVGPAAIVKQSLDLHTSTICQLAAAQYLSNDPLALRLPIIRRMYQSQKQAMVESLTHQFGHELSFNDPDGGMFLWARFADKPGVQFDTSELLPHAIREGVMFVPGAQFFDSQSDPATLRLSFATATEQQCAVGVERLRHAFETFVA